MSCLLFEYTWTCGQKYFADIKHVTMVTVTADSPDLSDSVTELAYSILNYHLTIEEENILVYQWIYLLQSLPDLHVVNVK